MRTHSSGFWTKERCHIEALKYTNRRDFHFKSKSAYGAAWIHGWLDDICSHMELYSKPSGYWTKERCAARAKKYIRRSEFQRHERAAYSAAWKNGWLNDICAHMQSPHIYSKEECREIALMYHVERDWRINSAASYSHARKNGWLTELTSHMRKMHRYTKEECGAEAKKYDTRKDFIENSPQYYFRACKKHWIKEICQHMKRIGNHEFRKIYVFEFEDHHAYVGLAKNPEERKKEHLRSPKSYVYKYIKETGCGYVFKELSDFLPKDIASEQEDMWINRYALAGWTMINQKAGGDLGYDSTKYTKKVCAQIAQKYKYRVDFIRGDKLVYNAASRRGFLKEICAHMQPKRQMPTKEEYKIIADKYKTVTEFNKRDKNAYRYILKRGWFDELCTHMKKRIYWTDESVVIEARKYQNRMAFRKGSLGACNYAIKHGLYELCCAHMKK